METLVLSLMAMVGLSFLLKLTFAARWQLLATMLLVALFVGLSWPWAIEQSRTQIAAWLSDANLMRDTSVLLSLDIALVLAFCWLSVTAPTTPHPRRRWLWKFLGYYPSLLIFPVLFTTLVSCIFALPGFSFPLIAWGLAIVLAIGLPLMVIGLRSLLPEVELRLELLFMLNVLIAVMGIVATVNGGSAVPAVSHVDIYALLGVLGLTFAFALMGYAWWRFRQGKKSL